jgi:hypothetical protein
MQTANKSIVADRLRLGETFSTTIKEKPVAKFSMNKSLSKGIKYIPIYSGKTISARSLTPATRSNPALEVCRTKREICMR